MRFARRSLTIALVIVAAAATGRARVADPMDRIREADLKADLFTLAGDAMRGREGGTLDELSASMWIAERARAAGLQPAGDNGTYFQFFPLERFRVSPSSIVNLGGHALRMGRDVVPDNTVLANVDAPVVSTSMDLVEEAPAAFIKGKVLVVRYLPAAAPPPAGPAAGPGAQQAMRNWLRAIRFSSR